MKRLSSLAGLAVPLLALSAQGGISQLNISYYGDYGATVVAQTYVHNTLATAFSADRIDGDTLPIPHTDPFVTFCLDINNNLGNGWWKSGAFNEVPLTNDSNPADRVESGLYRAASLYKAYSGGILNTANGQWIDKKKGAALQLAIWEVLYEKTGTYSIDADGNAGNDANEFYVNPGLNQDVRDAANAMLASSYNTVDTSLNTTFWNAIKSQSDPTYRSSQDLIGPVPEPTTYLAGALLVLPFVVGGIRRKIAA